MSGKESEDPRVRRTRDALGDALIALVQEKPFESITVQDLLDRAGVGRSTFYAHFSDKDDLLLSDVDDFFRHMSELPVEGRVAPVRELFAHVAEARPLYDALQALDRAGEMLEIARGHFASSIASRLPDSEGRAATAEALAGALFSLLAFWVRRGMREPPAEMDALFHKLVHS